MYRYETLKAFEMSGMIIGWSILATIVLIGFAAFSYTVVQKRIQDKTVTGIYSLMLILALIGYTYVAYKAPSIRGNLTTARNL